MSEKTRLAAALGGLLGASSLGYGLVNNPEGYVLAVVYQAITGFLSGIANAAASRLVLVWSIATDTVVGGLGTAIGAPFRLLGDIWLGLLSTIEGIAVSLASMAGPLGFVVFPAVWAFSILGSLSLIFGIWRAYKWIRTVVA